MTWYLIYTQSGVLSPVSQDMIDFGPHGIKIDFKDHVLTVRYAHVTQWVEASKDFIADLFKEITTPEE